MDSTAPSEAPSELIESMKNGKLPGKLNPTPTMAMDSAATLPERPAEPKISKAAAKKEAKKAANKAIKQESKKEPSSKASSKQSSSTKAQTSSLHAEDPEYMFKVGFLADVYKERPVGSEGIKGVITRCGCRAHKQAMMKDHG